MNPEIADLLRGKTKTEIFFNDCSTPLTDSDSDFDVKIGNEYYFFVYVQKILQYIAIPLLHVTILIK